MEPQSSKISYVNYKLGGFFLGLEGVTYKRKKFRTLLNYICYVIGINKVSAKDFPDQIGLSWENIKTMSHRGTHVDAPSHFGPLCKGEIAKTCSELPLDWFFHDGILLDMSYKKRGELITLNEIQEELKRINYKIKEFDIVLIRTDMDKKWNSPTYLLDAPGLSVDAVKWLVLQGVKVIGIDSYSLDLPATIMVDSYLKDKDNAHLWPVHMLGREYEYCHIEKLANLDKLPSPIGFKVCSFPVHIKNASAGWARVVAIYE